MRSVSIEPLGEQHADSIQEHAAHKKVANTANLPVPWPNDGGKRLTSEAKNAWKAGTRNSFAILVDGAFAGVISLDDIDRKQGTAELDYWVAAPFQNKGVATQAVGQVIAWAKDKLKLRCLWSGCQSTNWSSARVLEKNGFTFVKQFDNTGQLGEKFIGRRMCRFRLALETINGAIRDPKAC